MPSFTSAALECPRQLRNRALLWSSTPLINWLWMQSVHEFGHVIGIVWAGGRVIDVDLHPLRISQTLFEAESDWIPLIVWMGPVFGCLLPLCAWGVASVLSVRWAHHFQFFAGFCLIANGAYLGSAAWTPVGDALTLTQHGSPTTVLFGFAIVTIPGGFWLWNGLGPQFGMGEPSRTIPDREAHLVVAILLLTATAEMFFSSI